MTALTRATLYELVWTKPIEQVGNDLKSSARMIISACRQNDIPMPPPHYWRMLANGSPPTRRALPVSKLRRNQTVHIGGQFGLAIDSLAVGLPSEVSIDPPSVGPVVEVEVTDPIALKIQKSIRRAAASEEARLRSGPAQIDIGRGSIDRASNILAALDAAIDKSSWAVASDGMAGVVVDGEKVELLLSEGRELVPHTPSLQEMREHHRYGQPIPEYDSVRSGRLQLSITNAGYLGVRQKWADGKRQRIEDVFQSFLKGIEVAAQAQKARRLEREERELRWAEEQRSREERERLATIERVRGAIFKQQAAAHEEAQRLRTYIEAVKHRVVAGSSHEADVHEWITWAEHYVKTLDPLDGSLPILVSQEDALRLRWEYREQ